jgi:hypothetical protein
MGFACPVCSDPQADGGHLANHLAFTAMLGDEAHEAWLEEYAPGWAETGEAELADVVVDHVDETEFPQVFEDTAGGLDDDAEPPAERSGALFDDGPAHDHAHQAPTGSVPAHDRGGEDARMDEAAEAILEEAREMTRGRLEGDAEDDGGGTSAESGGASGAADDGGGTSAEGGGEVSGAADDGGGTSAEGGGGASGADDDGGGSGRRG